MTDQYERKLDEQAQARADAVFQRDHAIRVLAEVYGLVDELTDEHAFVARKAGFIQKLIEDTGLVDVLKHRRENGKAD